ncbi:MAG: glycosyltransferase family 2 protein [Nitrospirota bacterium]|nr:MAG: glycosyltransferase family 2 protein [Nitrospirota bacterium]
MMKNGDEILICPKVAIVILNWNGESDTIELLSGLLSVTYPALMLIVIDNASEVVSVEVLTEWIEANCKKVRQHEEKAVFEAEHEYGHESIEVRLIRSSRNLGFCEGNNLGIAEAVRLGAEYVLLMNNDTLVTPGFLEPMVSAASDRLAGLVGGIITYCDDKERVWWAGGKFDAFLNTARLYDGEKITAIGDNESFSTEWISGCMMMIPSRIYKELGGLPAYYFIWGEEWDYSLMISNAGYRLVVATGSVICHKVGRSLGIMQPLNYYYGIRNGLYLRKKYLSRARWFFWFAYYMMNRTIRYLHLMLTGRVDLVRAGCSAITDFVRGKSGKWDDHD